MMDFRSFWQTGYRKKHNNNIPVSIPSHPYVLMNRSILCNCDVEAERNLFLESLAACKGSETKTDLEIHFTINMAFVNYLSDIIEELGIPVLRIGQPRSKFYPC